jgi:hypothetical protein
MNNSKEHTELVNEVVEYLRDNQGLLFWPNPSGAYSRKGKTIYYGRRGSADIIGCFRSRTINIECKTGSGRQEYIQKKFQGQLEAEGGIYAVVRCWGDAKRLLRELQAVLPLPKAINLNYLPATNQQLGLWIAN